MRWALSLVPSGRGTTGLPHEEQVRCVGGGSRMAGEIRPQAFNEIEPRPLKFAATEASAHFKCLLRVCRWAEHVFCINEQGLLVSI
jgi:hypothetical protein